VVLSLFAELVSNDKPLVVRYEGSSTSRWSRTIPRPPSAATSTPTDYLDPFIRSSCQPGKLGDLPAQPLRRQDHQLLRQVAQPGAPSRDNWLGTDDRGRDLLAQLIYGFRVSVLFAPGADGIGVLLGVAPGGAGLLRRQDRSGVPALHRDLGRHARAVPADHLQRHLRAQRRRCCWCC
jgi:microcin C transport system permease protein